LLKETTFSTTRIGKPSWGFAVSNFVLRRGLLDTSLVIAIQTGEPNALQRAHDLLRHIGIDFSEFSAIALLVSSQDSAEHNARIGFINTSRVHRITTKIARAALKLVSSLPVPMDLTADDAIIAATALEHSLPLYT
jgi:predicted nucleic acid-binding protein